MQRGLFDAAPAQAPPTLEKPPASMKYRVPLERHEVKKPWGTPDRRGNLFWEKMHKELEKLPVRYKEFFNYITMNANPDDLERMAKAIRMLCNATHFDRIDFDESRGRL